jgi:hypothetical protein
MSLKRVDVTKLAIMCATLAAGKALGAVDYDDFPPNLRVILDQRTAQLSSGEGICIAGRVAKSDGSPIQNATDVQVNIHDGVDEPTRVYGGGWFIMSRTLPEHYAGPGRNIAVRALGYDPLDAEVTILNGTITYLDFMIHRTPLKERTSIVGTVWDENGDLFVGAHVSLRFPLANFGYDASGYSYPHMERTTGQDGEYEFAGLSSIEHSVVASHSGYAFHREVVVPPPGSSAETVLQLFPNRRVHLRFAYQANGTRDLSAGQLTTGVINWKNGDGGADFSEGVVEGYEPNDLRDLELVQTQDVLEFRIFYANGSNGFYDAGAVDFDSVTTAAASGYMTRARPVEVGHVYVVRTYEENHYVKLLVESDESSFRTVGAGDPAPIVLAGYDLTADFESVSAIGQVAIDKQLFDPTNIASPTLPFYWELSGMEGVSFRVNLEFGYSDADLFARGVPERGLALLRSIDHGVSWSVLPSIQDPGENKLLISGLTSLGDFAIASALPFVRGDADDDGDLDLQDYQILQNCLSGSQGRVTDSACLIHIFDVDSDVDLIDAGGFVSCLSGPNAAPPSACHW